MNSNGEYTHSSILNNPTTSQINSKVLKNAISVIFAVIPQHNIVHWQISDRIEGATSAMLYEDPSNVIQLVKDQYNVSLRCIFIHSNK